VSLYELLLFVHVLAAAAWYGAALLLLVVVELAARVGDRGAVLTLGEYEDRLASLLFIPSALVVLASGIALVFDGPWSWGEDGWVIAGLVTFAVIFVLGIAVIVPAGKKLKRLAASGASESALDAQIRKLRTLSVVDVALLTVAIFFMTVKPF
jgi:uncharacterized membrane protein